MLLHFGSPLLLLGLCMQLAKSANILAVFTYGATSPYLVVAPLMKALVAKGHQVTIISSGKHLAHIDGARHIRIQKLNSLLKDFFEFDVEGNVLLTKWQEATLVSQMFYKSSLCVLEDAGVQTLLHDANAQFDLVIQQAAFLDALIGFAQHYNAILVGLSIYDMAWNIDYLAGNKAPSIYEPISPEGYSHGTTLLDKVRNWIYISEEWLLNSLVYLPPQLKLYKKYFNRSDESFHTARANFSLMLINQHFSLGRVRSNVPNVIEIAGIHLNQPTVQMDSSLVRFLDEAENGVVLFSMGVQIMTKWLPPSMLQTLLDSFNQLQLRVVWKFDGGSHLNLTENIYTSSLLPQRELLAHPKVKLFVTHAGILSTIEAAYYGVPMLCLPVYYDQFGNAGRMKKSGLSQTLDILTMDLETTTKALRELIENPIYAHNAKQMSMRFRDQPMSPEETAVWWMEYVLRHQGASHMRLSEQDMSLMHYYSLDMLSVLFGRIGLATLIVICLGIKLFSLFSRSISIRMTMF